MGNMMGIINPLKQQRCVVEKVNDGACSAYYVECSDFSSQLPVLTGPFMTTEEGAVLAWNDLWHWAKTAREDAAK